MCHVVVIGAGITGVTTAYELSQLGYQVTVVDRHLFYEQFIYHVITLLETALKVLSFVYFYRAQPQLRTSVALYWLT